jgi:hypothetical protein
MLTLVLISIIVILLVYILFINFRKDKSVTKDQQGDCQVGEWSNFGACTDLNGVWKRSRTREVIKQSKNGGEICPVLSESEICNALDCQVGEWSDYNSCLNSQQTRNRKIIREPQYGGVKCPELIETKMCQQEEKKCASFEMKQSECFKDESGKWRQRVTKDFLNSDCQDEVNVVDCPFDKIPVIDCKRYDFLRSECYKDESGNWKQKVTKDFFNPECQDEITVEDCPLQKARLLACKDPVISHQTCYKNDMGEWKMMEKTDYQDSICEDKEILKDCPISKIREIVCINPTIVPVSEVCSKSQKDGKWYKMSKNDYSDEICTDDIFYVECPLPSWPEINGFTKMEKKDYTTNKIIFTPTVNTASQCASLCRENVNCTGFRMEGDTLDKQVCTMKYELKDPSIDTSQGVFYRLNTPKHPIIAGYNITLGSNDTNVAYRSIENTTPTECAKVCQSDAKCAGFWFNGFPGETKKCDLKDKIDNLKNTGVGVFYTRLNMEGAWPLLDGFNEPQNQKMPMMSPTINKQTFSSVAKCAKQCRENKDCTAFYYDDTNSWTCELKKYTEGGMLSSTPRFKSVLYVKK